MLPSVFYHNDDWIYISIAYSIYRSQALSSSAPYPPPPPGCPFLVSSLSFWAFLRGILTILSVLACALCGKASPASFFPSLCDCTQLTPLISISVRKAGPAGIWEEQRRMCDHKSDGCMVCRYPPLIILLPHLFIPWATSAALPSSYETFVLGPRRVTDAPGEGPGYCCDSCADFLSWHLTFCVGVYASNASSTITCLFCFCKTISCKHMFT